ncbi:MAG: dockerin type I repeat-containing protein [Clostridia bacterium]|nr:dockerin type I repeat-containing protein [Clostridia bacterium]
MSKRIGAILLALVLALSLCPLPAAATATYTVTLPAGATGETTVAAGEDYIFTIEDTIGESNDESSISVAYAGFEDNSICAAEVLSFDCDTGVSERRIPAGKIKGNFNIETFEVDWEGNASFFSDGDGTEENPWKIKTELDLLMLMAESSAGYDPICNQSDIYIELDNNIEFNTPLNLFIAPNPEMGGMAEYGVSSNLGWDIGGFYANFNGKGHVISGLGFLRPNNINMALIPQNEGVIKNLTLVADETITVAAQYDYDDGSSFTVSSLALLAANNMGTIDNCHVIATVDSMIQGMAPNNMQVPSVFVGLIAANNYGGIIRGCSVQSDIQQESASGANTSIGFICGSNGYGSAISNCTAQGSLKVIAKDAGTKTVEYRIGGIAGNSSERTGNSVDYCVNYSDIEIVEQSSGTAVNSLVMTGGIVGKSNHDITQCANYGDIVCNNASHETKLGGIAAMTTSAFVGCYNIGTVTVSGNGAYEQIAGGLAAYANPFTANASFSYIKGLPPVGSASTENISYTYTLADTTDSDADETSEEKELSAADFADPSLVTTLNTALGEDIFAAGTDYPVFSWLAAPAQIDLVAENKVTAPAASVATVTATAENGTATLNVICDKACVVIAFDGTAYTRLNATQNAQSGYDFTGAYADGVTFTVAVKGDVSGDGDISAADFGALVAVYLGTGSLDALGGIIGDVSGDGDISAADFGALVAVYLGTGSIPWLNN